MFGFPAHSKAENFRFTRNLLNSVTFQVKYDSVTPAFSVIGGIIDVLLKTYPNVRRIQKLSNGWEDAGQVSTPVATKDKQLALQFTSEGDTKSLAVTEEAITLTIAGQVYSNFAEAQAELYSAIQNVSSIIDIKSFNRVAVRKINSINAEPDLLIHATPWQTILRDVFRPEIVTHIDNIPSSPFLLSTITNSRFRDGNNQLNLIYGIGHKEAAEGIRPVILDIDAFSTSNFNSFEDVKSKFLELNQGVFDIFMWVIKDEFRDIVTSGS